MQARNLKPPYAKGEIINGIIIVERDKEFDDNPLFYINSEYPTNKLFDVNQRLIMDYEFYTDKAGNKYLVCGGNSEDIKIQAPTLLFMKSDWNMARNVDKFVEGADKDNYAYWLIMIS